MKQTAPIWNKIHTDFPPKNVHRAISVEKKTENNAKTKNEETEKHLFLCSFQDFLFSYCLKKEEEGDVSLCESVHSLFEGVRSHVQERKDEINDEWN